MEDKKTEKKQGSEFKILRQIEDVIEGIIGFLIRFVRTTFFLLRYPRRITQVTFDDENDSNFSRPFTYLILASIVFSPLARFIYKTALSFIDAMSHLFDFMGAFYWSENMNYGRVPSEEISPLSILQEIPEFSIASILSVTLPTVLVIVGISALIGTITQRLQLIGRKRFIQLICYVTGFQFVIFSTIIFIYLGYNAILEEELLENGEGFVFNTFIVVSVTMIMFNIIWPTIMIFSLLFKRRSTSLLNRVMFKTLFIFSALIISLLLTASASLAPTIPLLLEEKKSKPPTYVWSVQSAEVNGSKITAHLLLTYNKNTPLLLLDEGILLEVWSRSTEEEKYHVTIPLSMKAWSDAGKSVMEIRKGETKWIIVEGQLNDSTSQLLMNAYEFQYDMHFEISRFNSKNKVKIYGSWK